MIKSKRYNHQLSLTVIGTGLSDRSSTSVYSALIVFIYSTLVHFEHFYYTSKLNTSIIPLNGTEIPLTIAYVAITCVAFCYHVLIPQRYEPCVLTTYLASRNRFPSVLLMEKNETNP